MSVKVKYLRTIVHGEALLQFDLLSADVEIAEPYKLSIKTKAHN